LGDRVECPQLARKHHVWPYVAGDGQLPQPVREAQGDLLEHIDQHVIVEGAVKLRFPGQRSLRVLVERDRGGANSRLDGLDFDFRVFGSPEQLSREIMERNKVRNRARMVAGYCWDWQSRKNPAADVVIPEHLFVMRWNLTKDGGLWIVAPESANEIGCIHTCQGLEVDYIGVIVGPDLVFRDNRVVVQPERRSKHDKSLNGHQMATDAVLLKRDRGTLVGLGGAQECFIVTTVADVPR
jgi:DUF2075 family protein